MLGTLTERFSIAKSFGIGKANFGFWEAEDGQNDDGFFEEPIIAELVLQTQVGPLFSISLFSFWGTYLIAYAPLPSQGFLLIASTAPNTAK